MYQRKLKYLRENSKEKQYNLAKLINIESKTYSAYETEEKIFPIKHLNTLSNHFNTSLDYIFEFTNKKQYDKSRQNIDSKLSGERLKKLRKENKLTQKEISDILVVKQSTIAKYEKGINIISTYSLYTLCSKYHVSADYLLGKIDISSCIKK